MLRNEETAILLAIAAHQQLTVPAIEETSCLGPRAIDFLPSLETRGYIRIAACPPGRPPHLVGTWAITHAGLCALGVEPTPAQIPGLMPGGSPDAPGM